MCTYPDRAIARRMHHDKRPAKALRRSVVKVLATSEPPDYDQPWQTRGVENATGSCAIIDTVAGLRVLTNAHVVENAVFIELRRYGHARKYVAAVEGIGHECDLALLKVEKQEFFRGTIAFPIGTLPTLGDHVSVLGFRIGGDRISVTESIVSRIEVAPYAPDLGPAPSIGRWLVHPPNPPVQLQPAAMAVDL